MIIFVYSLSAKAIRCYQCSTDTDPTNEDSCGAYKKFQKDRHVAVECNSDESVTPGTFCMKVTQQSPRGFICKFYFKMINTFISN